MIDNIQSDYLVIWSHKVKSSSELRFADASVFPDIVNVNICNTVMMMTEHAAELIVRDSKL